ncbi:hypothetical protein JZ751_021637 [Albula glossodonta]|uniref:Uncharacterized protein n=1 Tax=Albula glossodonta TaxID=121402 RepID=A0A8T2NRN3_9TELE|nr:hypothetical protein JZ751_021637 [Albula glossodonta]
MLTCSALCPPLPCLGTGSSTLDLFGLDWIPHKLTSAAAVHIGLLCLSTLYQTKQSKNDLWQ